MIAKKKKKKPVDAIRNVHFPPPLLPSVPLNKQENKEPGDPTDVTYRDNEHSCLITTLKDLLLLELQE